MHFPELAEYSVVGPPDWFLSGVLASVRWESTAFGGSTIIAYSSKPYVYIFLLQSNTDVDDKITYKSTLVGQISAHHDRICGISLCVTDADWDVLTVVGSKTKPIQLFTCGHDGSVRHWVHADSEWLLAQELNVRSLNDALLPTAVDSFFSSHNSALLVLIGCNKGMLIVWCIREITQNHCYVSKKFESEEVLTLSWNPHQLDPNELTFAVGYRKGLIGVYGYKLSSVTSSQKLTQLSRFHAHEKDICGLLWRCSPINVGEPKIDLVSTGRDQFVKVWDVEKSWCHSSVRVPGSSRASVSSKENSRSTKNSSSSIGTPWISACQTKPGSNLWISGLRGEIYEWSVDEVSKTGPNLIASNIHTMLIFSMRSIPNSNNLLITVSQDRQVLVWQCTEQNLLVPVLKIPTVAGGIFALVQSDHGNGPIAAGVSDGSLLLWRPFSDSCTAVGAPGRDLVVLWPRGQNANGITALAWHPSPKYDSLLAYGTEAGCVDLLDTAKPRKITSSHKSKAQPFMFGTTVYRVVWGPLLFDRDPGCRTNQLESGTIRENGEQMSDELEEDVVKRAESPEHTEADSSSCNKFSFYVYSICKGKIFCHFGFQRPPLDVTFRFPQPPETSTDEWVECKRADICFLIPDKPRKTNNSDPTSDIIRDLLDCIISVGYRDGRVDVYARRRSTEPEQTQPPSLFPVCTLSTHTKGINCLAWSYDHYRIAIGSNEHFITVVDLTQILLDAVGSSNFKHIKSSACLARLEGHCNRITGLDWSPHDPSLLLSSSFDGTANVWSIQVGESRQNYISVANFRAHRIRLFSCLWSRAESDLAYSGGEMRHLLGWRPSKLLHSEPPNTRRYRPPPIKKVQNVQLDVENNSPVNNPSTSVAVVPSPDPIITDQPETEQPAYADNSIDQPESPTVKSISSKKSTNRKVYEKSRKRPSLFPLFLLRPDTPQISKIDLTASPPIQLSSKLAQILHVFHWLYDDIPLPSNEEDLLFLLPDSILTRRKLIHFFDQQANYHFQLYHTARSANGLMHLDAWCMIQLWMGRVSQVSSMLIAEHHLPFWLLWCLQMTKSTEPWPVEQIIPGVDIPGEKVKELMSTSSDIFICATILVSSGRSRDAVDLLINNNRMKEALLLARFRLDPEDAQPLITRCLELMIQNQIVGDVPYLSIIHQLGYGTISSANTMIQRASISQSSSVIDELGMYWTQFVISLRNPDSSVFHSAVLQLIRACLIAGFELNGDGQSMSAGEEQKAYFDQWKFVFTCSPRLTPLTSSNLDFSFVLPILDTALLVSHMTNQDEFVPAEIPTVSHTAASQLLMHLDQFSIYRMPGSQWSACMLHVVLGLTAVIAVIQIQANEVESSREEQAHRHLRLSDALRDCEKLDSVRTRRLIHNLTIFSNRLGLSGTAVGSALYTFLEQ